MIPKSSITLLIILQFVLMASGCKDEAVRSYTVPKGVEKISAESPIQAPVPHNHTVEAEPLPWEVPSNWREIPDNPPMRLATFHVDGPGGIIEITVTRFPGNVGGLLANVNRWRGQIGLTPIEETELDAAGEKFESAGFVGHLFHLRGEERHMLAANLYESKADQTWFVRVVSSEADVDAVKAEFQQFARSFRSESAEGETP